MTPQDERVHEFIRDLNHYRHAAREQLLRDVPQVGTEEFTQWMERNDRLVMTRTLLVENLEYLLEEL